MLLAKKNLNFMHRFKSAILAKLKNCRENLNFTNFLFGDMNNPDELLNPLCLYGKLVGVCLRVIFGMFWVRYGFVGLSFVD